MKEDFTDEELIEFYLKLDLLKKQFKINNQYGFDLMPEQFALRVRQLKTQVYGLRVQGYFAYHLGFTLSPSSLDCGDFRTRGGHDIEFKVSFLDEDSDKINVKQIRNWQDLNYYYIFTIDYSDYRDIKFKSYELTKEQMIEECNLINAKPVANVGGKNEFEHASLGFSIRVGSEHYLRWEEKYLNKKLDINKVVKDNLNRINTDKEKDDLLSKQAEIIRQMEEKIKALEACKSEEPKSWFPEELTQDDNWSETHVRRYDELVEQFSR